MAERGAHRRRARRQEPGLLLPAHGELRVAPRRQPRPEGGEHQVGLVMSCNVLATTMIKLAFENVCLK